MPDFRVYFRSLVLHDFVPGGVFVKDLILMGAVCFSTCMTTGNLVRVYRQWSSKVKASKESSDINKNNCCTTSANPLGHPHWTLLPVYQHCVVSIILYRSPLYPETPLLVLSVLALAQADLSLRMIISGVCKVRYPLFHLTMVPLQVFAAFVMMPQWLSNGVCELFGVRPWEPSSFQLTFGDPTGRAASGEVRRKYDVRLILLCAWELLCVLWVAADTISRICRYFGMPFLTPLPEVPWNPGKNRPSLQPARGSSGSEEEEKKEK